MSFMEKVSNFFGLEDDEYMEDEKAPQRQSTVAYQQSAAEKKQPVYQTRKTTNRGQSSVNNNVRGQNAVRKPVATQTSQTKAAAREKTERKVVAMDHTQKQRSAKHKDQNGRIMIVEPKSYAEAMKIARHVLSGEAVLVNFHLVEEMQARRIVDFLTGTVYALDGDIKRVANEIFLCTPQGVEINGAAQSLTDSDLFDL
ncbi:MAG TPA: cell division protein SepF [Tetragenococcus sp.]|nr:cell division protein SepF [Tetragenococcus sp.]